MDEKALVLGLATPDPGARVKVLEEVLANQPWQQPALVVETLVGALGDGKQEVRTAAALALCRVGRGHDAALTALVNAALREERLVEVAGTALRALDRHAAEVVSAALCDALTACRDSATIDSALALLSHLGPDDAKFLKRADLNAAAETLQQALPTALREARISAVDALVELKVPIDQLIEHVNTLPWPADEQVEVQRHLARRKEKGAKRAAQKKRQQSGEQQPLAVKVMLAILFLAVAIGVAIPFGFAFRASPLAAGLVLAALLAIAFVVALFWFRCPSCKRFWAGKLERVERQRVAGTAQVRDTSGVSHTVSTQRVQTTRHYRCRHCSSHFTR